MICYKDRTFCASVNCKNECGRKLTELDKKQAAHLGLPISFGYFCDNFGEESDYTCKQD